MDFLGLPCPNRAFSKGCADPLGHFFFLRSFAAPDGRVSGVKNARRVRRAWLFALCGDVRHGQCTLSRIPIFSKEKDAKEFSRPATGLRPEAGWARFTQRFQIPPPSRTQLAEMHGSALRNSRREAAAVAHDTVGSERPDLFRSAGPFPYARSSTKSGRRRTFCGKPLSRDSYYTPLTPRSENWREGRRGNYQ